MKTLVYYAKGRFLVPAIFLLVAELVLSLRYWYLRVPFYLTGQGMPTYLIMTIVIGQIAGTLALACIAPRIPLIDRLATRKVRFCNVVAAAIVALVSATIPFFWYQLFTVIPIGMVPCHKDYIADGQRFTEAVSSTLPVYCFISIMMYMVIAITVTALAGKLIGTVSSFITLIAVILVQAIWPNNDNLQGGFIQDPSHAVVAVVVVIALLAASLTVWYLTDAGAPLADKYR
ncbi:glucan phosphoethanolaminetransferase (alkaline phosphatase superfamily) [Bifidobacterium commune]|uniref:Uncharacterized protein n=1 Tax=Bifidobacterium commune TaxID=1505727 RepID=A0A1C4H0A9_9BIFI|nr:hypothetical protein [Bifidobacterium commune]MBB2955273.1 glucan phosphoethanolaminetransferase (alkaline phosphatase superfamily) [Bifidobacterium commune]SCC78030.1 hypothetical protein GA0061077_0070 [Bifidobacterium commune]